MVELNRVFLKIVFVHFEFNRPLKYQHLFIYSLIVLKIKFKEVIYKKKNSVLFSNTTVTAIGTTGYDNLNKEKVEHVLDLKCPEQGRLEKLV